MPVTTKVPLGASTLNRKWCLDVNTGVVPGTPVWTGVFGMTEFQPSQDPTSQDDSDFDSEGWKSSTITAQGWSATGKVSRKTTIAAPDEYDPGQEFLRLHGDKMGTENSVHIRYYEYNGVDGPMVEAYEGRASVGWSPDGGGMDALSTVGFTLSGQGKRTAIAHPGIETP